ncbi:Mut7-C RNAse domain-containing protein [Gloeothece verrucosa]|uniref:Twitching motility protein PilT n=1 Tax=Gloeothece verrucosa (strain PCC 7822) TaxID=497965 RepID=E0U5X2_GLOV7|nr:Mut7-C RNAse domain-containing protein [Gloeothece verrucosa]ADN17081.1 protein of unknown function DUF82 [Gloeothece verrucosa PCC 7822]
MTMMFQSLLRFEGQLNDLLAPANRRVFFTHSFLENPSIKDVIESLGVPHPEVNVIFINGKTVDFSYSLQHGDQGIIYPHSLFPELPHEAIIQLQPPLPQPVGFVLDVHLGKLASLLRLLGFDTLYRNDYEDAEIAQISAAQQRIVLTRDKGVLMRKPVVYGYYVRETDPQKQILEVLGRYNLFALSRPMSRCIRCNGIIKPVEKAAIIEQLPRQTCQIYENFYQCNHCNQIYWQGTHYQKMQKMVETILENSHQLP